MEYITRKVGPATLFHLLALLNFCAWGFIMIPNFIAKGLATTIQKIETSPFGMLVSTSFLFSIISIFIFLSYLASYLCLGPLNLEEKKSVYKNFLKENQILQLGLLVLRQQVYSPIESLLWGITFTISASIRSFTVLLTTRLHENNLKNLKFFNFLTLALTLIMLFINIILFKSVGTWVKLLMNFDFILILKSVIQIHCQLYLIRDNSPLCEIILETVDNGLLLIKWLMIGFNNKLTLTLNPLEIIILIKLQSCFADIFGQIKQYSKWKAMIKRFKAKFPVLSQREVDEMNTEKCCICWDSMKAGECIRVPCRHVFHFECIWKWMLRSEKKKCPICRKIVFAAYDIIRN